MNLIITESQFKKILKEVRDSDIGKLITDFINSYFGEYETLFYNHFDDENLDVSIEYHVEKCSTWKDEYGCTVYIIIDRLLVGSKNEDRWERLYGIDDIPEYIWEDLKDEIWTQIKRYFHADVDFDIYMYTGEYMNESVLNESVVPEGISDLLFDVIEDYKDSCEFFDDELDFAEAIIDYTISRAVSQSLIEPTTEEYIEGLQEILFNKYGETLMSEYDALCKNQD